MHQVENAITAPLENFDLVVEPFDKATILSLDEIVGDFLPPGSEHFEERVKALQATKLHLLDPALYFGLCLFLGQGHVKDGSQSFTKNVSLFCSRGMLEEVSHSCERRAYIP